MAAAKSCKAAGSTIFRITYDSASDLYNVEFIKPGRCNSRTFEMSPHKVTHSANGIYAEDLRELFEDATGLYLSLGTMHPG